MHPNIKVIGLVGKKESGKDSIFLQACELEKEKRISWIPIRIGFADGVKKDLAVELGVDVEFFNRNKKNPLIRKMMQEYGIEKRREDPEHWIKRVDEQVKEFDNLKTITQKYIIFITDCRFLGEAQYIKKLGGKLVRVRRNVSDNIEDNHISETELTKINYDDLIINDWNIERLKSMTLDLLKTLYPEI